MHGKAIYYFLIEENSKWTVLNDIKSEESTKFELNSVVILIGKTPVNSFESLKTITLFGTESKNHLEEFIDCLGRYTKDNTQE